MAPLSVFETCDWTATDAKLRGRYFRARASITVGNGKAGTENRTSRPQRNGASLDAAAALERGSESFAREPRDQALVEHLAGWAGGWPPERSNRRSDSTFTLPAPLLTANTPGLTKRRKTPHAAATFGVLTELVGSRPSGPGAPEREPAARHDSTALEHFAK